MAKSTTPRATTPKTRKPRSTSSRKAKTAVPEDAVVIDETPPAEARAEEAAGAAAAETSPDANSKTTDEKAEDISAPVETETTRSLTEPEDASPPTAAAASKEDLEPAEVEARASDPKMTDVDDPAPTPKAASSGHPPPPVRRPSVIPAILLGAAAGAATSWLVWSYLPPKPDAETAAQIAGLEAHVEGLAAQTEATDAALEQTSDQFSSVTEALAARVAEDVRGLDARLVELESRPPIALTNEEFDAAYQAEIAALRQRFESMAAGAEERLAAAEAEAAAREAEITAAAARTEAAAAAAQVVVAIDEGVGFTDALQAATGISGIAAPAVLSEAAVEGVATLSELQNGFPAVAREALMASRRSSGESGSVTGFLRTQLGVRSLEPQEGNGPDAVLSRAEAALANGALSDALTELTALPDAGQAAMSDWRALAETRRAASNAAAELAAQINTGGE